MNKNKIKKCFALENITPEWDDETETWHIKHTTDDNCDECENKRKCKKIRKDMSRDLKLLKNTS